MGTNTPNQNLYKPDSGESGWASQHNQNWDKMDTRVPYEIASNTETLSGGSTPALETTIQGVTTDQFAAFDVVLNVETDPAFSANYGFNKDVTKIWNDGRGEWDVILTVNWDTDPGPTNDVTIRWSVQDREV